MEINNKEGIMSQLDSSLTFNDIEILLESMNDWEAISTQEMGLMNMIKSAVMPPEDHESYAFVNKLKDHFKKREKEIKDYCSLKQEQAILLRAKLMLIKQDLRVNKFFENACSVESLPKPAQELESGSKELESAKRKLQLAEDFIKDMGVTSYYEAFLSEHSTPSHPTPPDIDKGRKFA